MKVLIVEDEPLISLSLEDEIVRAGHQVIGPAISTRDAMLLARRESAALALVDLDMRVIEESIHLIRSLKATNVPSIVMSYAPDKTAKVSGYAMASVSKPFTFDDIPGAIDVAAEIISGRMPPPPPVPLSMMIFR